MFITTCRIRWYEWHVVPFCGTDDPTWLMDYRGRDVPRWRHAWLVLIHVHAHVADDVLYDFIKLTEVNTEHRSNTA